MFSSVKKLCDNEQTVAKASDNSLDGEGAIMAWVAHRRRWQLTALIFSNIHPNILEKNETKW